MMPYALKQKKTYLEHFQVRQVAKANENGRASPTQNQELQNENVSFSNPATVEERTARSMSHLNANDIEDKESIVFSSVLRQEAKRVPNPTDLTEYERECLGFPSEFKNLEANNTVINTDGLETRSDVLRDGKNSISREKVGTGTQQQEQTHEAKIGANEESSSTWTKLLDNLAFKTWFLSNTNSNNNVKEPDLEEEPVLIPKQSISAVYPYDLLNSGIPTLLEQVCNGDHPNGEQNCFKCSHTESFKAFTAHYLNELECIWRNRDLLNAKEQDTKVIQTLESWIFNLSEQNMSLAEAYNESFQASEKLKSLLLHTRNTMRTMQKERDKHQVAVDGLNYELSLRDKTITKLKGTIELESLTKNDTETKLHEAQNDVESLIQLIIRLRDKGVWDINGLPLGDATFKQIFNGNYYLHGAKVIPLKEYSATKKEWDAKIDDLKGEADTLKAIITAKEREIERYQNQIKAKGGVGKTYGGMARKNV